MRPIWQLVVGSFVGVIQYLFITGLSYLIVHLDVSIPFLSALVIFAHCLVITITLMVFLYETPTLQILLVRIGSYIVAYLLIMMIFAQFGMVSKLEQLFSVGKATQNMQGLVALSLLFWSTLVSIFLLIGKIISFFHSKR